MVKDRLVLTGTDNDGFRHRYSIKKNDQFKKAFLKFMDKLGFDSEEIDETFYYEDDETGERGELKISEFEDCIRHYQNKEFDVDVFYGRFKIIIVVRTKGRKSMVDYLENESGWIKASEIKKIREKDKNNPKVLIQRRRN
jgi:hypothetical protein|tara:strand:+ start:5211 stop:5630 length:420 start_codon:yes stop_codon:yes gene_type:complete